MKMVIAIVRPEKLDPVKDVLTRLGVRGMTVSQVMGFGSQLGWKEVYRGSQSAVKFLPKIKLEVVVADELLDKVVQVIIAAARTGEIGDGKIFTCPVANAFRIRTGESGGTAI